MMLVKPATVVQWHRNGFRLYWRWRLRRPGRPKIRAANPLWGAPRIHGELLKLGIKISQATVGRWMPWRPKVPSPTWRSFLRNHLSDIAAIDMFVVATATFRLLYALIVLSLDRRRVVHFEVTQNPTQLWLCGQMTEAFPWDTAPRYLLRDRDKSYGPAFRHRVRAMGITEVITAPRSPWQNPYAERLIGSIRRECLDHIIILSEVTCAACYRAIFNIIMTRERIFRSTRTAHGPVACNFPPQATLLPSRRWVVSITAMSVEPRKIGAVAR